MAVGAWASSSAAAPEFPHPPSFLHLPWEIMRSCLPGQVQQTTGGLRDQLAAHRAHHQRCSAEMWIGASTETRPAAATGATGKLWGVSEPPHGNAESGRNRPIHSQVEKVLKNNHTWKAKGSCPLKKEKKIKKKIKATLDRGEAFPLKAALSSHLLGVTRKGELCLGKPF